ncbi:hypothetical protein A9Q84_10730 [Halobacteriovorax marinus]|uniref:Uncharacterized protein n=1 Tax=Halobacteriovorax marinus TaxID=97084 RepID=A0A1Y5F7B8_9BACT|nr:hypothetical protein A9Q84_10730 [Halobacteriovorax marinus]
MKQLLLGLTLLATTSSFASYDLGNGGIFSKTDSNGIDICRMDIAFGENEKGEYTCTFSGFKRFIDPQDEDTYMSDGLLVSGIVTLDKNHKVICVGSHLSLLRPVKDRATITENNDGTIDIVLRSKVAFGESSKVECKGMRRSN